MASVRGVAFSGELSVQQSLASLVALDALVALDDERT
jgi:hypothetical protein